MVSRYHVEHAPGRDTPLSLEEILARIELNNPIPVASLHTFERVNREQFPTVVPKDGKHYNLSDTPDIGTVTHLIDHLAVRWGFGHKEALSIVKELSQTGHTHNIHIESIRRGQEILVLIACGHTIVLAYKYQWR